MAVATMATDQAMPTRVSILNCSFILTLPWGAKFEAALRARGPLVTLPTAAMRKKMSPVMARRP